MTSPLPPKRRDSVNLPNLLRQDRVRLTQLDRGLVGGRFPPARPLKQRFDQGDEDDFDDPTILFENADRKVATGPGTVTFKLSREPLPGSLHIRWNGLDQPPTEWTLNGQTVTVPDPASLVRSGDVFSAAYAYEDGDPDVSLPVIQFIGATTAQHSISSIALPAGTQSGDLLVLASAAWSGVTTSDPRIVGSTGTLVAWGYADSSGAPVAVAANASAFDWASTVLAVYRDVTVVDFANNSPGLVSDVTLPAISGANAAIGVVLAWNGPTAGTLGAGDTTGAWTANASENSAKTHVFVNSWQDANTQSTPPGAFHLSGDPGGITAVTLNLGAA